jgi:hypothetical protein
MPQKKSLIKQNQIIGKKTDETHKRFAEHTGSIRKGKEFYIFQIHVRPMATYHVLCQKYLPSPFPPHIRKAYREYSQPSGREGKQIKELHQFHIPRITTVSV